MSWGFDLNHDIYVDPAQRERAVFALENADWFLGDCYTEFGKRGGTGLSGGSGDDLSLGNRSETVLAGTERGPRWDRAAGGFFDAVG